MAQRPFFSSLLKWLIRRTLLMTRQLTSAVRHKLLRSPHAKRPPHGRLRSSRHLVRKSSTDEMRVSRYLSVRFPTTVLLARNKLRIARDTDMMDDSRKKDRMYLQ